MIGVTAAENVRATWLETSGRRSNFSISLGRALTQPKLSNHRKGRNTEEKYLIHRVAKTLRNLTVEVTPHLGLCDVLQRWKNGILDLRLDGHLNHSGRVFGQLIGNELQ
jgi:hypothetical protein